MAASTSIARSIARWLHGEHTFPAPVLDKARLCLADMIGISALAADLPASRQAARVAERASVAEVAFANAAIAHGLVQEDMHTASVSHIGVVVWPTLLALAEREKRSGMDLLIAGVAGYQVMARVGQALITKDVARVFRPTGLIGPVGGAAAAARFLDLSEDETVSALSLAANTAGGLNEWPRVGGDEMFFHAGFAARNAVTSVLLAREGAHASESAFDGPAGLFAAFGSAPRERLDLDGEWEILAVYHKPAPACNFAQTPAQAALELAPIAAEDVEEVLVRSFPEAMAYPGCDCTGPYRSLLQAKMSIQYVTAAALVHGKVDDAVLRDLGADSAASRLARRVRLESDAQFARGFPQRQGAEVVVTLRTGRKLRARRDALEPLSAEGVESRTREALVQRFGAARAGEIQRELDAIAQSPDAGRLARLLGAAP